VPLATTAYDSSAPAVTELGRQIDILERLGYPELLDLTAEAFRTALDPLVARMADLGTGTSGNPDDHVPFVLVVPSVPAAETAPRMTLNGKRAALMLDAADLVRFVPTSDVDVPASFAYLLTDVDTGSEFCNIPPVEVLPIITGRGRSPITIAEGIAMVTLRPDMLRTNKCFSLLGSRCGDRRVPAVWISKKAPKLGWCWNGAPHTWLGAASAGGRVC
jgi:hypothetical protein